MEFPFAQMVDCVLVFRLAERRGKRETAKREVSKGRLGMDGKDLNIGSSLD